MANEQELVQARKRHAEQLREAGTQPFPNDFVVDDAMRTSRQQVLALATGDEEARAALPTEDTLGENPTVMHLWGRVVAKRGPFLVIRTPLGDAQALVRKDTLSESEAAQLKVVDLSDHVATQGPLIRTKSGAAAIRADHYRHLGKSLLPPPGKWHGLKDVEKRYRERYVDLHVNPDVAEIFRARATVVKALRAFLDNRDFVEVETPLLHPLRGGATARPFTTHHNALDLSLYLRIAPELYLKRLLVGGFERVYEIGRAFRNEGISTRHNPEFTILEFYMAYADHRFLMDMTVELLRFVDDTVKQAHPGFAQSRSFSLAEFARVTMREAVVTACARLQDDIDKPVADALSQDTVMDGIQLDEALRTLEGKLPGALAKTLQKAQGYGDQVYALFEHLAEPHLPKLYRSKDGSQSLPVFIHEFPRSQSPLARSSEADPEWVDRFELFVEGREVANAFSELNDPEDQAARFRGQLENRSRGDEEAMDFDEDYIRALSCGMPPAGGFGIGVDRLVMMLLEQPSIRDVLLFPLLRPEATTSERDSDAG